MQTSTQIYWLGGSPCSGKSSVAERLAAEFNVQLYHVDVEFDRHIEGFTVEDQPALTTWLAGDCAERWLKPVATLTADVMACYAEHFTFILDDVRRMVASEMRGQPLLVEGTALLPELVQPHLAADHHGLWLVPTPEFQQRHYRQRPWVQTSVGTLLRPGCGISQLDGPGCRMRTPDRRTG